MARWQLWTISTRNLAGEYPSEDAALRAVRDDIARYGRDTTRDLMLGDLNGKDPVIKGAELAQRALERFPDRRSA
jgi:hypothetical protein